MKKAFYVFCTMVLGILISFIILTFLERAYLVQLLNDGSQIPSEIYFLGLSFYLPLFVIFIFFVFGSAGGVMVGFYWWQCVYIDRLCRKTKKAIKTNIKGNISSVKKYKITKTAKNTKKAPKIKAKPKKK